MFCGTCKTIGVAMKARNRLHRHTNGVGFRQILGGFPMTILW